MTKSKDEETEGLGSFEAKKVRTPVKKIEAVQKQIDDIMQAASDECAPLREDIARIKKEAHEGSNIPRRELNSILSKRRLLAKAEAVREKLSGEQQDNFDQLELALDMLPDSGGGASRGEGATVTH